MKGVFKLIFCVPESMWVVPYSKDILFIVISKIRCEKNTGFKSNAHPEIFAFMKDLVFLFFAMSDKCYLKQPSDIV